MSPTYASGTDVSSDRSRNEIERTLARYGASHFGYMSAPNSAMVGFTMKVEGTPRQVRFVLPMPSRSDHEFTRTPTGKVATASAADTKYEQAVRQRWRALALVVKAKLEAVEAGISEFDQEFGMHVVLPNGRTVYEQVMPQVQNALHAGVVPPMFALTEGSTS